MGLLLSNNEVSELNAMFALNAYPWHNSLLSSVMKKLRQKRTPIPEDYIYSLTYLGDIVQLWLQSPPCRFSEYGSCSMCNYWKGRRIHNIADKVTASANFTGKPNSIIINTCGSVLDSYELPIREREHLFTWLNNTDIPEVILETHIYTLTEECISHTAKLLERKQVCFEVGIESSNPQVLFYCLNKPNTSNNFKKVLDNIHRHKNFKVIGNVILGAPFLTRREQETDARNSIMFLLENGFDYVVVFPVNIKPLTIPELLFKNGMYHRIHIDSLINVLENLPYDALQLVNTAWYGNRCEKNVLPPYCDTPEKITLMDCYNKAQTSRERKNILEQLCRLRGSFSDRPSLPIKTRLENAYHFLQAAASLL